MARAAASKQATTRQRRGQAENQPEQLEADSEEPAGAGGFPSELQTSLDGMGVGQLRSLQRYIEQKIRERAEGEKAALIQETERRARELGLSIRDLFGEASTQQPGRRGRKAGAGLVKGERAPVPPKYRGPGGEEWSGRGRRPGWAQGLEDEELERYRIQPAAE